VIVCSVDSCQQDECSPEPTAKRKIIPSTKLELDLTFSPSSSLPDLSDLDGQQTPDDLDDTILSSLHDGEADDMLANSVFGPALDWEGETSLAYLPNLHSGQLLKRIFGVAAFFGKSGNLRVEFDMVRKKLGEELQ